MIRIVITNTNNKYQMIGDATFSELHLQKHAVFQKLYQIVMTTVNLVSIFNSNKPFSPGSFYNL